METLVKVQYNKKFKMWEALTAFSVNKANTKHSKFGNDFNITADTEKGLRLKIQSFDFGTTFKTIN